MIHEKATSAELTSIRASARRSPREEARHTRRVLRSASQNRFMRRIAALPWPCGVLCLGGVSYAHGVADFLLLNVPVVILVTFPVGLIEAVERFEWERGVAFSIFAIHRIKGRMLDCLKGMWRHNGDEESLLEKLPDSAAGPSEIAEERFLAHKVRQVLARLPQKEELVLRGIYLEHLPASALASTIQVSQTHVYRLQKKGIRRLRGMLSRFIKDMKQ
jgi:RNA polymerase sporulation-specific sigma factor